MPKIKSENKSVIAFRAKKGKNKWKALVRVVGGDRSNVKEADKSDSKHCCQHCDYTTDGLGRLNAHQVCHSTTRPFVCKYDDCGQAFKRHNSLQRHVKALHLKERLFACGICQKKFSQNQSLQDHIFIHCDLKSFSCPTDNCPKVFQTPKYLKAHLNRRHPTSENSPAAKKICASVEEMKSQAMDQLKKAMQQKNGLSTNTNINNLSPIEPFRCEVDDCTFSCRLWRSLRSHYKFAHSHLYNPKTKTIDSTSNAKTTDSKTASKKASPVPEPKRLTIECHDTKESIEIEVSTDNPIDDNHNVHNVSHNLRSVDNLIIQKMSSNTYFFECNFLKCNYRTKSFDKIADHFIAHWDQMKI